MELRRPRLTCVKLPSSHKDGPERSPWGVQGLWGQRASGAGGLACLPTGEERTPAGRLGLTRSLTGGEPTPAGRLGAQGVWAGGLARPLTGGTHPSTCLPSSSAWGG